MIENTIKIKSKDDAEALLIKLHGSATEEQIYKLWDAGRRNTKVGGRDSALWIDGATGYQTCPLTGFRKARFDNRTVSILGFTYDEYVQYLTDNDLPVPKKTNGFMDEVNAKLLEVDLNTGKSKRDLLNEKSRKTLLTVGEDGLTGDQRRGLKTSAGLLLETDDGRTVAAIAAQARNTVIMGDGRTLQQHALAKARATMEKTGNFGGRGASLESKQILSPIIEWLTTNAIPFHFDDSEFYQSYWVPANMNEFTANTIDKNRIVADRGEVWPTQEDAAAACVGNETPEARWFFYDLTIPSLFMNIEYQGYESHPSIHEPDNWESWHFSRKGSTIKADQMHEYNEIKLKTLFKNTGFRTWEIWAKYPDVNMCLEYLKEINSTIGE